MAIEHVQQADLTREHPSQPPSSNPLAGSTSVMLSVPESVEIRLVDATTLADLAIWSLLTSILSSAVVGFGVAYFQTDEGKGVQLAATAFVFSALMLSTGFMMIYKGRRLYHKAKKVSFRLGSQTDSPSTGRSV